jgi:nucleotide-binding universal stress UspA family protein
LDLRFFRGDIEMRVLLPVDGSKNSIEAASVIPHLTPAEEVIVLYVLDLPQVTYPLGRPEMGLAMPVKVETALRDEGEHLLSRAMKELPREINSITGRTETGSPAQVIVDVAEKEAVDLIVIGARGLSQIQEIMLGSVSHQVLGHATCPVLLMRHPVKKVERVLVPVQGEDDATAAVHLLSKMPFRTPPEVTVLTVLPFHEPLWPGGLEEGDQHRHEASLAAKEFSAGVVKSLVDCKYPATAKVLMGKPTTVIQEEATQGSFDLIIMGSRRRKGLKRLLLGSVSHSVVHRSQCPVLILR